MYLLDTNIVIFFFKGRHGIDQRIQSVGAEHCFISEITLAELLYGAEKSSDPAKHFAEIEAFIEEINVLPLAPALRVYAAERARLERQGMPIDDFDLLIGAIALANHFVLVTNNVKHFGRLSGLKIEDWTQPAQLP